MTAEDPAPSWAINLVGQYAQRLGTATGLLMAAEKALRYGGESERIRVADLLAESLTVEPTE